MNDTVNLALAGTFHEATVPDTLDLAERARLALNGLGGNIDPDLLTMYGLIHFCVRRPHLSHWASAETTCDPKFAESFPLMRVMSGSDQYADLERRFRESVLSRVDDGLYWDRMNPRRPWRNSYSAWCYGEGKNEDFCTVAGAGRLLRALLVWRELGGGARGPGPKSSRSQLAFRGSLTVTRAQAALNTRHVDVSAPAPGGSPTPVFPPSHPHGGKLLIRRTCIAAKRAVLS